MSKIYILPESVATTLRTVVLEQRTIEQKKLRTLSIALEEGKRILGYLIIDGFNYNVLLDAPDEPTIYRFTESFREALTAFETAPSNA